MYLKKYYTIVEIGYIIHTFSNDYLNEWANERNLKIMYD